MAKKKQNKSDGDVTATKRHEQPLQAVLLAHDWNNIDSSGSGDASNPKQFEFHPLCLDRPKILCPLLNVVMLDYMLEYLESQHVQELYVVCVTEDVESYLQSKKQKQQHQSSDMKLTVLRDTTVTNAGDALRELDKRNVISSDPFVLVTGDVVTNVDLQEAVAAHQQRHAADSAAMFTMLLQRVGSSNSSNSSNGSSTHYYYSPLRSATQDLVIALDPKQDNRILLYDDDSNNKSSTTIALPCSFFASHCDTVVRTDLLDVGLYLCSPDVLARFSDAFDYRDIRKEFVTDSAAEEEECLQNKLYAHILSENNSSSYAARIHDARTFDAVSRDLLKRYCYPITPDNHKYSLCISSSSGPGGAMQARQYAMHRHYLYHETTGRTILSRSSKITGPGMVGANCFVGENCVIRSSVLGDHCHIADRVQLVDCHLWEGVEVEEGCSIQGSILAQGVVVKAGAVISKGCIIGANCVVGANVQLPEYTRLTCVAASSDDGYDDDDWGDDDDDESGSTNETNKDDKEHDDGEQAFVSDTDVVGIDGKGRLWKPSIKLDNDSDGDEENMVPIEQVLKSQCIGFNPADLYRERCKLQREDDDDSFSDDDAGFDNPALDGIGDEYADSAVVFGESLLSSSQAATVTIGRQEGVDVVKELKLICLEFESATSPIENLAIELNSYKFSQNATYSDCTMAATLAILEKMKIGKNTTDGKLVSEFKSSLDLWAPLLQKMSIGLDEEKAIVLALEKCAVEGGDDAAKEMSQVLSSGMSFRLLLQMLHDQEIVSEEAILLWKADRERSDVESPRGKLFHLEPVQDFLDWLDEESEEDDDDSDDDESESE